MLSPYYLTSIEIDPALPSSFTSLLSKIMGDSARLSHPLPLHTEWYNYLTGIRISGNYHCASLHTQHCGGSVIALVILFNNRSMMGTELGSLPNVRKQDFVSHVRVLGCIISYFDIIVTLSIVDLLYRVGESVVPNLSSVACGNSRLISCSTILSDPVSFDRLRKLKYPLFIS